MKPLPKEKKAALDISMGTLITIIMAMLILVLIIFGAVNGKLGPLVEFVQGRADEVLIALNIRDPPPTKTECKPRALAGTTTGVRGGGELLDELGVTDEARRKASFIICGDECVVDLKDANIGTYRINIINGQDKFQRRHEQTTNWNDYVWFGKNADEQELTTCRNIYETFFEETLSPGEKATIKEFYDGRYTKRLIFHADGSGNHEASFLIWQNGYWDYYFVDDDTDHWRGYQIRDPTWIKESGYTGVLKEKNDAKALNAFYAVVEGGSEDKINWWEGNPWRGDEPGGYGPYQGKIIGTLIGTRWDNDQIDDKTDFSIFKTKVCEKQKTLYAETTPAIEELQKIITVLENKKELTTNGITYNIGLEIPGTTGTLTKEELIVHVIGQRGATDLYYRYTNNQWTWSPDEHNWMTVPETTVRGGEYSGGTPVQANIEIIKQLEGKNYEEGTEILQTGAQNIDQKTWVPTIDSGQCGEELGKYPTITFDDGTTKYGLVFAHHSRIRMNQGDFGAINMNYLPLQLMQWDETINEWKEINGGIHYCKFNEEDMKHHLQATKIGKFLHRTCR